jgi:hypothetical protein
MGHAAAAVGTAVGVEVGEGVAGSAVGVALGLGVPALHNRVNFKSLRMFHVRRSNMVRHYVLLTLFGENQSRREK